MLDVIIFCPVDNSHDIWKKPFCRNNSLKVNDQRIVRGGPLANEIQIHEIQRRRFVHIFSFFIGKYIFIESSDYETSSGTAVLASGVVDSSETTCIQFWYHMRGREIGILNVYIRTCLLYTSPSPRDLSTSRMPSSA